MLSRYTYVSVGVADGPHGAPSKVREQVSNGNGDTTAAATVSTIGELNAARGTRAALRELIFQSLRLSR